jgi:hypothetical protein
MRVMRENVIPHNGFAYASRIIREVPVMAAFNPKMLAHDIARGLVYLNASRLKKYRPDDLKAILNSLTLVQREVRAKQIQPGDTSGMKEKNRQLQHVNQAITIINGYIKKHSIRL